ncbi:hypothetical protein [Methanobrevibacter sp.]|uniref:hypothetical protein n=1 Tax=Methanobrevibacter sp. TaxID=66852 RepID=UPI002E78B3EE|nr:hypothetical protein [Methanobrevibacter sp.]MEE1335378.1 hypothetical protein [Methanobrevibacter sp.]
MAKKELDIEEEVQRISRKTNVNIKKNEYSYSKQLERLDKEIDRAINDKIKLFDEDKEMIEKYKSIEFKHDTIDRYREKLKKI